MIFSVASASILVDVVLEYAKEHKVACHDDKGDDPGDGSDD